MWTSERKALRRIIGERYGQPALREFRRVHGDEPLTDSQWLAATKNAFNNHYSVFTGRVNYIRLALPRFGGHHRGDA